MTPESLFSRRIAADPSRPFVTFYDDSSGERAELSAKSVGNWIAKTHYLLIDELGHGPGSRAFVTLPVHWLAVPILFGCWFAGLEVISDPTGADVAFGDAQSLLAADLAHVGDSFAVSLLSMARSAEPPRGMTDFATAVRPQPDAWAGVRAQARSEDPALDGISRSELVQDARSRAQALGLLDGGRLMFSGDRFGAEDWICALVAPLAVGGSVVLNRNADPSKLGDRFVSERASASLP